MVIKPANLRKGASRAAADTAKTDRPQSVVTRLRAFFRERGYGPEDRLPPERELAQVMGTSRAHLRDALAALEASGEIWRHVGKGTFLRTPEAGRDAGGIGRIARLTTPMEVMEARLLVEPRLAALAALRATEVDFAAIDVCLRKGIQATNAIASQRLGDDLHRAIARAAKNNLLLELFEMVYAVRETTNWGRLKPALVTAFDLTRQWEQHRDFVAAIRNRDAPQAERLMRQHIESIQQELQNISVGHPAA